MNFNKEIIVTEEKDIIHLTILSAITEFSIAKNSVFRGTILNDEGYALKVFPNGMGEDDIGYVSLVLCHYTSFNNFEGTCIISVIDASDNRRFSQSFTCFDEQKDDSLSVQPTAIEKYISRKTLLSNPGDLLPNDTLTLKIDIYTSTNYSSKSELEKAEFSLPASNMVYYHRGNVVLNLDSPLGKRLAEESSVFRSILESPMIEGNTKMMHIPEYEYKTFQSLATFLINSEIVFNTVKEIFDMYIVADKYDIPFAVDFSRCFLKLCLSDHSLERLLEMTEELEDDSLKELMKKQINIINEEHIVIEEPIRGGFWVYRNYISTIHFWFLKDNEFRSIRTKKSIQNEIYIHENKEEWELFDFYK